MMLFFASFSFYTILTITKCVCGSLGNCFLILSFSSQSARGLFDVVYQGSMFVRTDSALGCDISVYVRVRVLHFNRIER